MAGPNTFNTPDRIIRMAMKDAGKLQDGDDPNSEQFADYLQRLNDLINFWQTQGLKLWLNEDITITLIAGTSSYTLGPTGTVPMVKPTRVLDAYYADANQVQRPLIVLSWNDWDRLSQRNQAGDVNSYFVDKQQTLLSVNFWLTPDANSATGTVHLVVQNNVANLVSITDSMNFPLEWFIALRWGLADELSTGQPEAVQNRCAQKAAMYLSALEDWDVEDAPTNFAPDYRGDSGKFT